MRTGTPYKTLSSAWEALQVIQEICTTLPKKTKVSLPEATGRVTFEPVSARKNIPHYRRSAMDGYAVQYSDTIGASPSSPNRLTILSRDQGFALGSAIPVHTGSEVPQAADSVIKLEDTRESDDILEVFTGVTPGENIAPVGEDIKKGQTVLQASTPLKPYHLSLLRALGKEKVFVYEKPRIAIIPTGEELVPSGREPEPGQAIQSNGIMVENYCQLWGAITETKNTLTDDPSVLSECLKWGLNRDMILFIGGSSVGERDKVTETVNQHGDLYLHGISIRPGKPLGIGEIKATPVICLPGYPVATLVDSLFFVKPALEALLGLKNISESSQPSISAPLGEKITSPLGKTTVTRIHFRQGKVYPIRTGGSGILSTVTKSDGYVIIRRNNEGIDANSQVQVFNWNHYPPPGLLK